MQILKGLYQLSGDLNGLTWLGKDASFDDCNTYLFKTPTGLIMFDAGCGDSMPQIFRRMHYWGLAEHDIKYCFLTHPHIDHAGGAILLQQLGVKIIAHKETAIAVQTADERCCGFLYHKEFKKLIVDQIVNDDESLALCGLEIKLCHFPGHTAACTAYFLEYEGQRIVVSGDIIGTLGYGDHGWNGSIDFNKTVYIESLKRFAKYDTDLMLPGHGLIYFHEPRRRVEQALNSALEKWR